MYAIGGGEYCPVTVEWSPIERNSALIYAPCIYYMSEWFVKRRGLANGTIDAGERDCIVNLANSLPSLRDIRNRRWRPCPTAHSTVSVAEVWQFEDLTRTVHRRTGRVVPFNGICESKAS